MCVGVAVSIRCYTDGNGSIRMEAMWSCNFSTIGFVIPLVKGALQLSTSAVGKGFVDGTRVRLASTRLPCFVVAAKQTRGAYFRAFLSVMADSQGAATNGGGGEGPAVELTEKQLKKQAKKDAKKAKYEKKMEGNKKQEQLSEVESILNSSTPF